jgi:predicted N-acyltransferase
VASNYRIKVFKTIDRIGKVSLDSIADDGFFTYGYFKTLESSKLSSIMLFYLSVYNQDEVVAVAPCFIDNLSHYLTSNIMRKIVNLGIRLGVIRDRLLICYSPNSLHSKVLFRKNSDGKEILDIVLKKIDDLCIKEGILFSCFQFVSEFDKPLITSLQNLGYLKLLSRETLYLDVKWLNFSDYLRTLDYKIRKNVRREIKKCKENGVAISDEKEFGNLSETLSNLHSNLYSKHNSGAKSPFGASFFRGLSEYAKDKTKVFIAKKNSQVIGFSLSLRQRDILDVYLCGFDYAAQVNTDFVYFNIAYYTPIQQAIKEGIKRIHFRMAAEEVKLKRGCQPEKTYWLLQCHNSLLRPLITPYINKRYALNSTSLRTFKDSLN